MSRGTFESHVRNRKCFHRTGCRESRFKGIPPHHCDNRPPSRGSVHCKPVGNSSAPIENHFEGRSKGKRGETKEGTSRLRMGQGPQPCGRCSDLRAHLGKGAQCSVGSVPGKRHSLFVQVSLFSPSTTTLGVNKIFKRLEILFKNRNNVLFGPQGGFLKMDLTLPKGQRVL